MSDDNKVYRVEIPLRYYYESFNDPEATPEHRLRQAKALQAAYACARLFWVVKQLGVWADSDARAYTPGHFHEALETIGDIGIALAEAAGGGGGPPREHRAALQRGRGEGKRRRLNSSRSGVGTCEGAAVFDRESRLRALFIRES